MKSAPEDIVKTDSKARKFAEILTDYFQDGIRWLSFKVHGPKKESSAALSRNHVIEVS